MTDESQQSTAGPELGAVTGSTARRRYTAEMAKFVFREVMIPCPQCGSYHLGYSMPIQMKEPITMSDRAKQIIGKWARTVRDGRAMLEGPVRIVCRDCHHQGPPMDCGGRTSEEVGRDKAVADEVKRLWNSQSNDKTVATEGAARRSNEAAKLSIQE